MKGGNALLANVEGPSSHKYLYCPQIEDNINIDLLANFFVNGIIFIITARVKVKECPEDNCRRVTVAEITLNC